MMRVLAYWLKRMMNDSGQPAGWRRFVPISFGLASYEQGYLAVDLIAALTVWALIVPESMAYARRLAFVRRSAASTISS